LKRLAQAAVRGHGRDFREFVDLNRAALTLHEKAMGPMLRRSW
jgi:hypothetical protein